MAISKVKLTFPYISIMSLTVMLAGVGGCASGDSDVPNNIGAATSVEVLGDDPKILVVHGVPEVFVPDIGSAATVRHDAQSGCIYFVMDRGNLREVVPLWPEGSGPVVDDDRRGVDVPGRGLIREGDTVELTGEPFDIEALAASGDLDRFESIFGNLQTAISQCGDRSAGFYVTRLEALR